MAFQIPTPAGQDHELEVPRADAPTGVKKWAWVERADDRVLHAHVLGLEIQGHGRGRGSAEWAVYRARSDAGTGSRPGTEGDRDWAAGWLTEVLRAGEPGAECATQRRQVQVDTVGDWQGDCEDSFTLTCVREGRGWYAVHRRGDARAQVSHSGTVDWPG